LAKQEAPLNGLNKLLMGVIAASTYGMLRNVGVDEAQAQEIKQAVLSLQPSELAEASQLLSAYATAKMMEYSTAEYRRQLEKSRETEQGINGLPYLVSKLKQ